MSVKASADGLPKKGLRRAPSVVGKGKHSRTLIGSGTVAPPLLSVPPDLLLCLPLAVLAQVAAG